MDEQNAQSSSDEENNDFYKNPMKRRIHDIQKLNLQNREMIMMAGHNKQLAQSIIRQRNLTRLIQQHQTKVFANKALCGCTTTNRFRSFVMQIVFNPWFDRFILLTIFANCISLAVEDPSRKEPDPIIEVLDIVFLVIFSIEMALKIITQGFVMQQFSYLRDAWNVLDFLVVVLGWVSISASSSNVSAVRVIRILRPLRTLNSVQGMRALVLTLLSSLPSILNIMLLFGFTLVIFGTIGVQLFKGYFQGRCIQIGTVQDDPENWEMETYEVNEDGDELYCQISPTPAYSCSVNFECFVRGNPGVGLSNWDNIFVSILTQFELITLEGWTEVMYKVRNAHGGSYVFDIFFILSVVFGAFFVLNLMITVQYDKLNRAMAEINEQKEKDRRQQMIEEKENEQHQQRTKEILEKSGAHNFDEDRKEAKKFSCKDWLKVKCSCCFCDYEKVCCSCWLKMSEKLEKLVTSPNFTVFIVLLILLNSVALATEHYEQPDWLTQTQDIANIVFTVLFALEMVISMIGLGIKKYCSDGFNIFDAIIVLLSLVDLTLVLMASNDEENSTGFITVLRGFRLLRIFKLVKSWTALQQLLRTIISSLSAISNLAVLSLLFLFVYSLIGKQYFYGDMKDLEDENELTRYHFNSTLDSMITMFIVLTGENWNEVMRTVIYNYPEKEMVAIFFFISAMLIGNTMLLNMFLAIMLKFLEDAVQETRDIAQEEQAQNKEDQRKAIEIGKQQREQFQAKIHCGPQKQQPTQSAQQEKIQETENIPLGKTQNAQISDTETPKVQFNNGLNRTVLAQAKEQLNEQKIELQEIGQKMSENEGKVIAEQNSSEDMNNNLIPIPQDQKQSEALDQVSQQNQNQLLVGNAESIIKKNQQCRPKSRKSVNFEEEQADQSPALIEEETKQIKQPETALNMYEEQIQKPPVEQQKNKNEYQKFEAEGEGDAKEQKNAQENNQQDKKSKKKKRLNEIIIDGNALGCIGENNRFRIALGRFVQNPYFDAFVYNLIGLNSLFLALEEPAMSPDDKYSKKTIELMGTIISGLFIAECVLKILIMGFIKGKYSYLKENYNKLDFVIVLISIVSWSLEATNVGNLDYLKALRALRALRPLKLVSKNEGMKLVVNSILASIPNLINVFLISMLFYFVFGVIGLQMLSGRLSYCEEEIKLDKEPCILAGYAWTLPQNNYNNVFNSVTTFFEVSTLETWPDIMFAATNSQDQVDLAPSIAKRKWLSILYISFIFVTTFFVMNLFISVIVGQFTQFKLKSEGSANLTEEQREWVKIQRYMAEVKAPVTDVEPTNKCRQKIYFVVKDQKFEYFITLMIALNTITMCADHYGASDDLMFALETCNLCFVFIFTLEAVLKLIGYGPTYYFYIDWNKFDFAVVIMSLISLGDMGGFNLTALRIIRVARLLRMIKSSKELQALLQTLYLALNNILIVATLFMLIIFTYAVAGMQLFGDIDKGEMINYENLNFKTFYLSVTVLIRSATGESWNLIQHDCVQHRGGLAYFYWMTFQLATFFIFLNVFIAVIYEEFTKVNQTESTLEVLSLKKRDIRSFLETWGQFNPSGEHMMPTSQFVAFIKDLPAPLGYRGLNIDKTKLDKIIFCLNIRDHEGYVYFPEVMWAIFYSIVGKNDKKLHDCKPMRNIMRKVKDKYSRLSRNTTLDQLCGNKFYRNEMTVTKYLCGKVILDNLRLLKKRREDEKRKDQGMSSLGRTSIYMEDIRKKKEAAKDSLCTKIWHALSRKPSSMKIHSAKKQEIVIDKETGKVIMSKTLKMSTNHVLKQ